MQTGRVYSFPRCRKGERMYTLSDIEKEISRGCIANNLIEENFRYRISYYVNTGNVGERYYIDAEYMRLKDALEWIIKDNLTLQNSVVIAGVTVLNGRRCIRLLNRKYYFALDDYFARISGEWTLRVSEHDILCGKCAIG